MGAGERAPHQLGWVEHRRFRVAVWIETRVGFAWIYSHPMTWTQARQAAIGWEAKGQTTRVVGLEEKARR